MLKRKRKRPDYGYKRCRCKLACYRWLAWGTRKRHYQRAAEATILPSDYGSEESDHLSVLSSVNSGPEVVVESGENHIAVS